MTHRVAVALGSNLGARLENMREAITGLGRLGRLERVSSLYETAPVGGPEQAPYLNAVALLVTELDPPRLLEKLHRLEEEARRVRRERWGARTLDLDMITATDEAGDWIRVEGEELDLPHPRAHLRRFVLEPLAEVWPEARVGHGARAAALLGSVHDQDVQKLGHDWIERRLGMARGLFAVQVVLLVGYGIVLVRTGSRPDGPLNPTALVGASVALAGAGVAGRAALSLGSGLSPYPEPRPGTELVAVGPYRLVRHPIYTGLILVLVGIATAAASWAGVAGAVLVGLFLRFKAGYEESRLRLAVPGYVAYQGRVRGRLIPVTKGPT